MTEQADFLFYYKKVRNRFNQKRKYQKPKIRLQGRHSKNTCSLSSPNSHCPKCLKTLSWFENIPIISYLLQRGRCKKCNNQIPKTYPLVELIAAVGAFYISSKFYFPIDSEIEIYSFLKAGAVCIFFWICIALFVIDIKTHTLPDLLTLALLWLGLLVSLTSVTDMGLESAVLGAICGYSSLWLIYQAFKLVTGKEGMGYGDFKLTAAICAWIGVESLAPLLLLSSVAGAVLGGVLIIKGKLTRNEAMPFGPFLILSGFVLILTNPTI